HDKHDDHEGQVEPVKQLEVFRAFQANVLTIGTKPSRTSLRMRNDDRGHGKTATRAQTYPALADCAVDNQPTAVCSRTVQAAVAVESHLLTSSDEDRHNLQIDSAGIGKTLPGLKSGSNERGAN